MSTKNNAAARIHAIANDLGCDAELVAAVRKDLGLRRWDDVKHAVTERLSAERAKTTAPEPVVGETSNDEVAPAKEKKPGLTLSQRRALLRLLDDVSHAPASAFKALPYGHLVGCGYATCVQQDDACPGVYTLTDAGRARAESINPGYRVWSAGETVAEDPTRPAAGTKKVVEAGRLV